MLFLTGDHIYLCVWRIFKKVITTYLLTVAVQLKGSKRPTVLIKKETLRAMYGKLHRNVSDSHREGRSYDLKKGKSLSCECSDSDVEGRNRRT